MAYVIATNRLSCHTNRLLKKQMFHSSHFDLLVQWSQLPELSLKPSLCKLPVHSALYKLTQFNNNYFKKVLQMVRTANYLISQQWRKANLQSGSNCTAWQLTTHTHTHFTYFHFYKNAHSINPSMDFWGCKGGCTMGEWKVFRVSG